MTKNLFRPFINQHTDKLQYLKYGTIGKHKSAYFDYTASGLAFRPIENRIYDMLTTYANTHSKESGMANQTNTYYEEALTNLKKSLDLNDKFEIIPSGCGSTAAIKRFQELLGLSSLSSTEIYTHLDRYSEPTRKEMLWLLATGSQCLT